MLFAFDGVEQVVTFTQEHFVGVSVADGSLLWSRPFTTQSDTTSQTPVRYRDLVIENGRGNGVTAFRVAPGRRRLDHRGRLAYAGSTPSTWRTRWSGTG